PKKPAVLVDAKAPQLLDLTPVPPPPPPVPSLQDCYNEKGFCVNVVDNHGEATVIVKDKDNKIVLAVSLTDWNKDKQQYEDKYGEVPARQITLWPRTVMGYKAKSVTLKSTEPGNNVNIIADKPYYTAYKQNYVPMYAVTPDSNVVA